MESPLHCSNAHLFVAAPPGSPLALIVLNQPQNEELLVAAWHAATLRVLADGAGTRLFTDLPSELRDALVPDVICGDLDSLSPSSRAHYEAAGVEVLRIEDQDSTDLDKCAAWLRAHCSDGGRPPASSWAVVVLSPFGGRVDHALQNLNSLHTHSGSFASYTLLSADCSASLLPPGCSSIDLCPPAEGPTVGLIPLGAPASVTTRGLKWNLSGSTTAFGAGGLVSTSNHVLAWDAWAAEQRDGPEAGAGVKAASAVLRGVVEVETSAPLIWTCSLNCAAAVAAIRAAYNLK